MNVVIIALAVLLAVAFAGAGVPKLLALPVMVGRAEGNGIPLSAFRLIGALELAAAAGLVLGLWWSPLGIAAATGLVLLMVGAVGVHLRAGDRFAELAPALVLGLLAAGLVVLGVVGP